MLTARERRVLAVLERELSREPALAETTALFAVSPEPEETARDTSRVAPTALAAVAIVGGVVAAAAGLLRAEALSVVAVLTVIAAMVLLLAGLARQRA